MSCVLGVLRTDDVVRWKHARSRQPWIRSSNWKLEERRGAASVVKDACSAPACPECSVQLLAGKAGELGQTLAAQATSTDSDF